MLCWNVIVGDFNSGKIIEYNIFNNYFFLNDCIENVKLNDNNKEMFCERLRKDVMYYFWSKCEWEVIIDHFPVSSYENNRFKCRKIDAYYQLQLNWNIFTNYVWENKEKLKKVIDK